MMVMILSTIIILLVLGVIYTIYSILVAEVDEGQLEDKLDENAYVKPPGWKEGKMPKDLPQPIKIVKNEANNKEKSVSVKDLVHKFDWESASNAKKSKTA
jgi:hypothetical protein